MNVPSASRRISTSLAGFGLILLTLVAPAVSVAQSIRETSALKIVPADASFYLSTLNNGAKLDAFLQSRAFAELSSTPLAEALVSAFEQELARNSDQSWEEMQQQMKDMVGEEQYQRGIDLAMDLFSNEMFVYGGRGYADLMEMYGEFNADLRALMAEADRSNPDEATMQLILQLAEQYEDADLSGVKLPDTVFGFTLKDPENAERHLEMLHALIILGLAGGEVPLPVRRGFAKKEIGDASFLTLTVTGGLLPLELIVEQMDDAPPEAQVLVERYLDHVSEMTLSVAVGVMDNFLLISVGDSLEHLETLGQDDLLIDRPEFASLRQHEQETFSEIAYVSERLVKSTFVSSWEQFARDMSWQWHIALTQEGLDPKFVETLLADVQKLGKQCDEVATTPGAALTFSYLTDRGIEGYSYQWAENLPVDGSKPLTILDQVGGDPAFFVAGRSKYRPEIHQQRSEWVRRIDWYVQEFGEEFMEAEQLAQYESIKELAGPFLERLENATDQQLVPALADSQYAYVFDLKNASRQWTPDMPRAMNPLPIPEFAIVCGISDREKFHAGVKEYYAVTKEVLELMMAMAGEDVPPELYVPDPRMRQLEHGAMYYIMLDELEAMGMDKMFLPNMGLTDDFAIFSLSQAHTERLLEPTELPDGGPFEWRDKPLAGAAGVNFVVMVDAVEAWMVYGEVLGLTEAMAIDEGDFQISGEEMMESLETLFAVARCMRGMQAVAYEEDGALVTKFEVRFVDIPW